jgi:hypothetical protein
VKSLKRSYFPSRPSRRLRSSTSKCRCRLLAAVAGRVEDLEQPHAVEALEAEELIGGDDAEVAPQLEQVRLELLVDLELDAGELVAAVATAVVPRLGDPLEHHPVAVRLLDLDRLLEQLARRLLDARVDALAADVEDLRVLPGRDPDRLEVVVVAGDVREREHQQPLREQTHLLAAERQRVGLRDARRAPHAARARAVRRCVLRLRAGTAVPRPLGLPRLGDRPPPASRRVSSFAASRSVLRRHDAVAIPPRCGEPSTALHRFTAVMRGITVPNFPISVPLSPTWYPTFPPRYRGRPAPVPQRPSRTGTARSPLDPEIQRTHKENGMA